MIAFFWATRKTRLILALEIAVATWPRWEALACSCLWRDLVGGLKGVFVLGFGIGTLVGYSTPEWSVRERKTSDAIGDHSAPVPSASALATEPQNCEGRLALRSDFCW